jgi:transposase InsO family protein
VWPTTHDRSGRPGRTAIGLSAPMLATLAWVDWFNTRRLLAPIGYVPPVEYEDAYYREQQ